MQMETWKRKRDEEMEVEDGKRDCPQGPPVMCHGIVNNLFGFNLTGVENMERRDELNFLGLLPKSRRASYLNDTHSEKLFTKDDLRHILEMAIKETREIHAEQCRAEMENRLQLQQNVFDTILVNENQ